MLTLGSCQPNPSGENVELQIFSSVPRLNPPAMVLTCAIGRRVAIGVHSRLISATSHFAVFRPAGVYDVSLSVGYPCSKILRASAVVVAACIQGSSLCTRASVSAAWLGILP